MKKIYLFLLAFFAFTAASVAQNVWSVELQNAGTNKTEVIKVVRNELDITLKAAKDLVDAAPIILLENASETAAESFSQKLRAQGATVELLIKINSTSFPDEIFRKYVAENCDPNTDSYLSATERAAVLVMDLTDKGIQKLDGIGYFTELQHLGVNRNPLEILDVSKNTKLIQLGCNGCQLTTLDVSKNTELRRLYCQANRLTSLDLTANTKLYNLACYYNSIKDDAMTALISSLPTPATEGEFIVIEQGATNAGRDNIITKEQISAAKAKNWKVLYNTYDNERIEFTGGIVIHETTFPDITFYGIVRSTYDKDRNCYLSDEELAAVKEIDVSRKKITDLTGIEYFTELENLNCSYNQLTALNLSANTALKTLSCYSNQLTALDLTTNTALETLFCEANNISGDAMDALVNSLCDRTEKGRGFVCIIDLTDLNEQNVCTTNQVNIATGKNWRVQAWNKKSGNYENYAGSEPTAIHSVENGARTAANNSWYSIDGKKLQGKPTQKGVYIVGGKKIIK